MGRAALLSGCAGTQPALCAGDSPHFTVDKLRANPTGFRVSAAQSKSLKKFLKDEYLDKKTNEIVDGRRLVAMIDDDKLNAFNELMGYYMIATSELDTPDQEIIDKYHGLTQIEDQFREMKGTLEARPVFVNTPEHIHAHLLVCFIALTMMRLVQRRIAMAEPKGDAGGRPQVVLRHVGRAAVKGAARMAGAASSGRPIPDGERVTRVNIGSNRSFQKMKWQSRGRTGLSLYL